MLWVVASASQIGCAQLNTMAGKRNQYDEKNIRRRIYDALNVLMAMDIITKVSISVARLL